MPKPKKKATEETATFDPKVSDDGKRLVLVVECSSKTEWADYLALLNAWVEVEFADLDMPEDARTH